MKLNTSQNAVSVYYPERDSPVKYEVELSESGAKKGEISRAFKKMLGSKSTNKKLLSSFIEYVA